MAAALPRNGDADERQPLIAEPIRQAAIAGASFTCLSGLVLGYDIGTTNGSLQPISDHFKLEDEQMELYAGILNLMAVPGCIFASWAADKFGRRVSIGIGAVMFLIGNALMTFAPDFKHLVLGRALAGFAVGVTHVTEPLYIAETSPASRRGMMSTNVEVSFNVGILAGFTSSYVFRNFPDDISWRLMIGASLIAPIASLFGVFFVLYESPRWLASQGRLIEAETNLNQLLGPMEASKILSTLKGGPTKEHRRSVHEVVASSNTRWLLFLGCGVAFFSQATGIESIMYYSSVILQRGGLTRASMLLAMVFLGAIKVIAILVQGVFVDGLGRRPLLILSSLGMSVCMLGLGSAFFFGSDWQMKLLPIYCFTILFSLGFGPIVYTLNAELFPTEIRSMGLASAMLVGRATSAAVAISFLSLVKAVTMPGAFACFAIFGLLAASFVYFLVPETSGKDVDEELCF